MAQVKLPAGQFDLFRSRRERLKRLGYDLFHLLFHIFHAFVWVADFLRCRGGPNGPARLRVDELKGDMAIHGVPDVLGDSVNRSLGLVQARSGSRMKALDFSR